MEAAGDGVFDANFEKQMLRYKLELLQEFAKTHEYEPGDAVDECRVLQYKIECIEGAIRFQNLDEEVLPFYEHEYSNAPDGFTEWIARSTQHVSRRQAGGLVFPPATMCCPHRDCINYVYGFYRFENLEQHLRDHCPTNDEFERRGTTDSSSMPRNHSPDDGLKDQELTYVPFDPTSSTRKREGEYLPNRAKRILDKANMKLVKDQGACLRCKILKKKCDDQNPCCHCPLQDSNTKGDHWKVLGCHRSPLKDLSKLFLPEHLTRPIRHFENAEGLQMSIDLSESYSILHPEASDDMSMGPTAWSLPSRGSVGKEPRRSQIRGVQPSPLSPQRSKPQSPDSKIHPHGRTCTCSTHVDVDNEDVPKLVPFTGPWFAVQHFDMNWTVTARMLFMISESHEDISIGTGYSPVDLMRSNRKLRENLQWENDHKTELDLVHRMISEAVYFFMFEKQLQEQMPAANDLSLNNHTPNDTDLQKFLEAFSDSCSRRTSLTVQSWLELFHLLCLFSIYKTILIDAYALRKSYEYPSAWEYSDAVKIDSVYRTLVSIFMWASGIKDPMISEEIDTEDANIHDVVKGTREMAKQSLWKERGIKSSKDFLMNLGSGVFDDGTFNGFVLQTYRLDKKLKHTHKQQRKHAKRMSPDDIVDDDRHTRSRTSTLTISNPSAIVSDTIPPSTRTPNPASPDPSPPTTKTTVVNQWLDGLSIRGFSNETCPLWMFSQPSNRHQFEYPLPHGKSSAPNDDSLGGTHTESWLENKTDGVGATENTFARPPFSLIFEE